MTPTPNPNLDALAADARAALAAAGDEDAGEAWRVATLGRSGSLTSVLRGLSGLPAEERRAAGRAANELKPRYRTLTIPESTND